MNEMRGSVVMQSGSTLDVVQIVIITCRAEQEHKLCRSK